MPEARAEVATVMPRFSHTSMSRLRTCDHRLVRLFNEIILHYDCTIICGHRGREEQEKALLEGTSKVPFGKSKHNAYLSHAVDALPYPIDWRDDERNYHFGGFVRGIAVMMHIPIRCGHDWDGDTILDDQKFIDLPHFELM